MWYIFCLTFTHIFIFLNVYIQIRVRYIVFFLIRFFDFSYLSPSPSHPAVLDKDLASAKALHEQMQKEGMVVDELSLKRLAVLYRDAGETVPFTEPPVSHKHTHTLNEQRCCTYSLGFICD